MKGSNTGGAIITESKIREWMEEVDRLAIEAEHLHLLLTSELGKYWAGEAFEACQRESRDNREAAIEVIHAYRDLIEECGQVNGSVSSLPTDFLL